MSWLSYALISAVAAALTAILAKIGVDGVPSTLATAIRTAVVMTFAGRWCSFWDSSRRWRRSRAAR